MRKRGWFLPALVAGLFAGGVVQAQILPESLGLMPMPAHIEMRPGSLRIDAAFRIGLSGYNEPRLKRAALRTVTRLELQTGMSLPHEIGTAASAALAIACDHASKPVQELGEDESYRLDVTPSGARLSAPTPLGILRGVETFLQLVRPGERGFTIPALLIEDTPRFAWRGLSYDVARHFMPLDQVKRTLDGMAAVKLNVLHWHLSDNQGFRVESKIYPRLQTMGSEGLYYKQAEIRELVAYARDRGIRVIPEIDIPGHTTAMMVGYPELACEPAPREIDRTFGVQDAVLDPTKPAVYLFLDRLIGEVSQLFPDRYFHIGGDEVNGRLWRESLAVQRYKQQHALLPTPQDLDANGAFHAMFNQQLQKLLAKRGKVMEGWDEILSPSLPKNIVIHSWRGQKSLSDAVRLGYQGILSAGWYLDLALPASDHYLVDPLDKEAATLTPDEQKRILGGEAAMWSEMVTAETMDSRLWPRCAVIAERLWSPRELRDVPSMYRRMEQVSGWLEWLGLTHRSWQGPMLQRIAGKGDTRALAAFSEMVEPVKIYEREHFGPYTTATPLIRLVDAVPPESEMARQFSALIHSGPQDDGQWERVRLQLLTWRDSARAVKAMAPGNDLLQGAEPLADHAVELTEMGIGFVDSIRSHEKRDAATRDRALARIQALSQHDAALLLVIADPVAQLVKAASE